MKRISYIPNGRIASTLFLGMVVALATISGCGRQEALPLVPAAAVVVVPAAPEPEISDVDFQDKRYRQTAKKDDFTGEEVD